MLILRHCRCRSFLSSGLLCFLAFLGLAAKPAEAVNVWQRWDQQLQVGLDYYLNGAGNPYQGLLLVVQLTGPSGSTPFSTYGFWDGGNVFRVRAAFPKTGTWTWKVLSCSGLNGKNPQGQILPSNAHTTLMSQTGQVTVDSTDNPNNPHPNNPLYTNGFLTVSTSGRYLTFTDKPALRFYWQGDTAWASLSLEGQKRLTQSGRVPGEVTPTWKSYVDDRSALGFTVLQVAPAVAWQAKTNEPVKPSCAAEKNLDYSSPSFALPGPETFAFDQLIPTSGQPPCVGAVPNNCSRWRADYWREVDSMVEYANEKGLVVLMVGVADPADRGGCRLSQSYPRTADSITFARNLAARLAGNHVIFSVNFDDWPGTVLDSSLPTTSPPPTVDTTTVAVGPVLKTTVYNHLIVNHLAGSAQVAQYTKYQNQNTPWLSFQLFQSGHANKVSTACPGKTGTSWQARQQCAVSRAIDLTKGLRGAPPTKPVINGEGAYEDPDTTTANPPDNRYGMRQTAYASLLNGAAGFTAGVNGTPPKGSLTLWFLPDTLFGNNTTLGIKDMQKTRTLFEGIYPGGTTSWGEFSSATAAFVEVVTPPKPNDPPAGERRILTGTKDDVFLTYLPNNPKINVIGSLGFKCSTWTAEWRDVKGSTAPSPICTARTQTQFNIPVACPDRSLGDRFGACDWLVFMRRPKSATNGLTAVGAGSTYLQVTTLNAVEGDPAGNPGDQLMAQVYGVDGSPISPQTSVGLDSPSKYGQPTVVPDGQQGNYWVVWEAEAGDDGTTDVFGRIVGPDASLIGDVFQVNQWTPDSQFDPFTIVDAAGNVTVVWISMGQDGDQGGIFARRFQLSGAPVGDEIQVNVTTAGDQESARGGTDDSGNVVIAWRSGDSDIKARIYSATGAPLTGEIAVSSTTLGREELINLNVNPLGGFSAHWETYTFDDQFLGSYVRNFDAAGNPLEDETAETPQ